LTGEIDYYKKNTTDILLSVPVPGTSGFRTQLQNIGEMENEGVEFLLNSYNFVGPFRWTTSLNLAYNDNRVVRLSEGQDIIDNGGSRYMNVVMVGEAIGSFYGLEYAGVDPQNGDALFYVNQMDDNGNIINENATTNDPNAANFVILGSPIPEITAGITNSFSYKGVGLDVTLQGVSGNQLHNGAGVFMSCQGCWFDNQTRDQLRAWQQPGDQTDVPEPRFFWGNGDNGRSSRYIEDGDFLRLKTVTLSYTLPESLTTRVGIQSVRIYATGQNLVTITDYSGWDPELTTDFLADADANVFNGVDFYSAPQPRTVVFGVKLGL
ncbi:MAG: SusC/RagA family TonB-linked outer membrane protein, partial [Saprospiraceae bacterium]|nr:SusC/RagA family TonB-linked outer membrane protein [Saprospiraceae bacterium]